AQDGSTNFPPTDPAGPGVDNWESETALDVQCSHAMARGANILLVEANDNFLSNMISNGIGGGAVTYARSQPGVSVISMSWGASEFSGETSYDTYFTTPQNHAGVAFVSASGDAGSPAIYPSFSPNVVSVGGTSVTLSGSNNISA